MTCTLKAQTITHQHIARVRDLLGEAAIELIRRGAQHDRSKLTAAELEPLAKLQELIDREGQAQFGTPEYERRSKMLGPMLDHHYRYNSHHPEHYPNGVVGMDLFDLIEMFLDWKAASERGDDSCMRLDAACKRFGIDGTLRQILINTAENLGWATDAYPGPEMAGESA